VSELVFSPMYSEKLVEQFWGVSRIGTPKFREAQRKLNQAYKQLIEDVPMARKTVKARNWKISKKANRIVAERKESEQIVGDAIKRMANAIPDNYDTPVTAWFDGPQGAGLHVLRTERGESRDYQVVRAVFINDGITQCYEIRWHGGGKIDMAEYTNPNFQRVNE
jgi:hypothetical protein